MTHPERLIDCKNMAEEQARAWISLTMGTRQLPVPEIDVTNMEGSRSSDNKRELDRVKRGTRRFDHSDDEGADATAYEHAG